MKKTIISLGALSVMAIFGAFYISFLSLENGPIAASLSSDTDSSVSLTGVEKTAEAASLAQANAYIVSWETEGFDKTQKVDINLIELISESPVIYKFVKKIAENTPNDGKEIWIPEDGEIGENTFVEVTCSNSISRNGCRIMGRPLALN